MPRVSPSTATSVACFCKPVGFTHNFSTLNPRIALTLTLGPCQAWSSSSFVGPRLRPHCADRPLPRPPIAVTPRVLVASIACATPDFPHWKLPCINSRLCRAIPPLSASCPYPCAPHKALPPNDAPAESCPSHPRRGAGSRKGDTVGAPPPEVPAAVVHQLRGPPTAQCQAADTARCVHLPAHTVPDCRS
jgi:hypothetical protein